MSVENKTTMRIDYFAPTLLDEIKDDYLEQKYEMTDEGFLTGRSIMTNIGVFSYLMEDGTIRRELRAPEHVLNNDSLASMKNLILTNDHPSVAITVDNKKDFEVGFGNDNIRQDAYHVSIGLTITDKQTIEDIQNGKQRLSAGYFTDIVNESGTWFGMDYDVIQTNIRYNHGAVVDAGRAGDSVKIRLDHADKNLGIMCNHKNDSQEIKNSKESFMGQKLKLDTGVEYEVDKDVIAYFTQTKKDVADLDSKVTKLEGDAVTLKKDTDVIEAERDSLKEKVVSLDKEIETFKSAKPNEDEIAEMVKARLDLETKAKLAEVETKDKSDSDIVKEIILKVSPDAKLDEKSEDYILARFDSAVETLEGKVDGSNKEQLLNPATITEDQKTVDDVKTEYENEIIGRSK